VIRIEAYRVFAGNVAFFFPATKHGGILGHRHDISFVRLGLFARIGYRVPNAGVTDVDTAHLMDYRRVFFLGEDHGIQHRE
jgi:hypothetical protein